MRFNVSSFFLLALTLPWQAQAAPKKGGIHISKYGNVRIANENAKEPVEDKFIVVLKKDVDQKVFSKHTTKVMSIHSSSRLAKRDPDSGIQKEYPHITGWNGYSGKFDRETLEKIGQMEEVDYIEVDTIFRTSDMRIKASKVQSSAPWGLSRISHKETATSRNLTTYEYDDSATGRGISVYVIDTGINTKHRDFGRRAKFGNNTSPEPSDNNDNNGHGSHCAGTIAGTRYGVAKGATVVALKALDGEGAGENSNILDAIDWVAKTAQPYKSVVSMSLGGEFSKALNDAVEGLVKSNIVVVCAAGNEEADAMSSSPGSSPEVITVGASDRTDEMAYFSNYGEAVDIFAPGVDITSAWKGSNSATQTISGTSMACPHIAGLCAVILSKGKSSMSPTDVKEKLLEFATEGALKLTHKAEETKTTNMLAFNGGGEGFSL